MLKVKEIEEQIINIEKTLCLANIDKYDNLKEILEYAIDNENKDNKIKELEGKIYCREADIEDFKKRHKGSYE